MTSRTRPGKVPVHVEPAPSLSPLDLAKQEVAREAAALNDVIEGRSLYLEQEDDLSPGLGRCVDPEKADMTVPSGVARRMADRVADLETLVSAQDAHIRFLHDQLDQAVEQIQTIQFDLSLGSWKPAIRVPGNGS